MSKEIRESIDKVKKLNMFLTENTNSSKKINKNFIDKLKEKIKTFDGVLDVMDEITYDENEDFSFYNNNIKVKFDDTNFYGFKLDNFKTFNVEVKPERLNKHLDVSMGKLDNYINKIEKIKNTITKIKKVVDFIDGLKLDEYGNVKFLQFSMWNSHLSITIYTHKWE